MRRRMQRPMWRQARRTAAAICALVALWPAGAFAADPAKVLRASIAVAETGFDPQAAGDAYSNYFNRVIFDPLYKYDYLARPFRLMPNTAAALPDISADRKSWTIRVKPGIYFAVDPVFKGRRRELTAADYVYSIVMATAGASRPTAER